MNVQKVEKLVIRSINFIKKHYMFSIAENKETIFLITFIFMKMPNSRKIRTVNLSKYIV